MSQFPAGLLNPLGIISGVHQVIEVGHLATGHFDQRDGNLAIM
jgi:hypothetical protein